MINTIQNTIQSTVNTYQSLKPVTQGMTLTASWSNAQVHYDTIKSATTVSVRVDATISGTDSGILMESGASTYGLVLYVYNGVLYFQCGDGSDYGVASNRAEISYTLPVGQFNYIVEWSADTSSNAVLYVNGVIVGSQTFNNDFLAGSDRGTVGRMAGAVSVNRGGWTSSGSGIYTNTITKCDIFNNQVTSDV
jgi:hypothetical protein